MKLLLGKQLIDYEAATWADLCDPRTVLMAEDADEASPPLLNVETQKERDRALSDLAIIF